MNQWKFCFFLLLFQYLGVNTEEAVVETPQREPFVTEVCTSDALNITTRVVCKVRTKRSQGEVCRLLYQFGKDFEHECGSRFRLTTENQTVFLHLTNLTAEDSENYTCDCSDARGTNTVHLNITMKGEGESNSPHLKMLSITTVIGNVAAFIIISGFLLGLALRKKYCRDCTSVGSSVLSVKRISSSLDKDEPDDTYTSLQQSANDFYQDFTSMQHQYDRKTNSAHNPNIGEQDGRETDHSYDVYENV